MGEPVHVIEQVRLPEVEQLQTPYLHTAEDLLPIDAIDLMPIRQPRVRPDTFSANVGAIALFVSEKAEGNVDRNRLKDLYGKTVNTSYEVDELFDIMDAIEDQHPRVRGVLEAIRDSNIFTGNTYVDVVKATWVMTAFRHLESQ